MTNEEYERMMVAIDALMPDLYASVLELMEDACKKHNVLSAAVMGELCIHLAFANAVSVTFSADQSRIDEALTSGAKALFGDMHKAWLRGGEEGKKGRAIVDALSEMTSGKEVKH